MSYDLFYDRQFIKVEDEGKTKFVPMVYGGSSNCFEVGRGGRSGRRERSWFNFSYVLKGKKFGTLEEMVANIQAERERKIQDNKERNEQYVKEGKPEWCDEYSDDRWGYFVGLAIGGSTTRSTTFGKYLGLITTGCKKALTVEELNEFGVFPRLYTYCFEEERKKLKELGKEEINHTVRTSAELVEKIKEFEAYLEGTGLTLYISMRADERKMKEIRSAKFPVNRNTNRNKNYEIASLPEFFVVKDTLHNNYVLKLTRNGYRYSYTGKCHCKRFAKESEANRFVKRVNEKYGAENRFVAEKVLNEHRVPA